MKKYLFLIFFLFSANVLADCNSDKNAIDTDELCDENRYQFMTYDYNHPYYGAWAKFVIFLNESGEWTKLSYQNSSDLPFHYDYLKKLSLFKGLSNRELDLVTLKRENRKALLGVLLIHRADNDEQNHSQVEADFQLMSHDPLEISEVKKTQEWILKSTRSWIKTIYYYPAPELRDQVFQKQLEYKAEGVIPAFPQGNNNRICYTPGWTVGRIKILDPESFEKEKSLGLLTPADILILKEAPREIPPVSGVITSQESSPNSHVALLTKMYGVPFVYEKNAIQKKEWVDLNGQYVFMKVNGELKTCSLSVLDQRDLTSDDFNLLSSLKKPFISSQPRLETSLKKIVTLDKLSYEDLPNVGGKAANLAKLLKINPQNTLSGIVIPISFYERFLDETGLRQSLKNSLIKIQPTDTSLHDILSELAQIRSAFENASFPKELLEEIKSELEKLYSKDLKLFFRSSSNVEDSPEFNGAGLYESESVKPSKGDLEIIKGLITVWSSLYSDRGYLARRWFGIQEENVAMAILVQPFLENPVANGVSLMQKMGQNEISMTMSGFPGAKLKVTDPPVGKTAETVRCFQYGEGNEIHRNLLIPSTEVPEGQLLLESQEYDAFFTLMKTTLLSYIRDCIAPKEDAHLDFEWMVTEDSNGKRNLVLLQVRQVPKSQSTTQSLKYSLVLPNRKLIIHPEFGEDPNGFLALQGNIILEAEARLFKIPEKGKFKIPFKSFVLKGRLGTYEIPANQKQTIESSGWGNRWENRESRTHSVHLALPNPELPSLSLVVIIEEQRDVNSHVILDPVREIKNLMYGYALESKDLISTKKNMPESNHAQWAAKAEGSESFNEIGRLQYYEETYGNEKLKFYFKSFDKVAQMQKTLFLKTILTQIEGILPAPLIIEEPGASVYAPSHHNFQWERVIDLFKAASITPEDQAQLLKLGGRYLQIRIGSFESPIEALLWTEDGDSTMLGSLNGGYLPPSDREPK